MMNIVTAPILVWGISAVPLMARYLDVCVSSQSATRARAASVTKVEGFSGSVPMTLTTASQVPERKDVLRAPSSWMSPVDSVSDGDPATFDGSRTNADTCL